MLKSHLMLKSTKQLNKEVEEELKHEDPEINDKERVKEDNINISSSTGDSSRKEALV